LVGRWGRSAGHFITSSFIKNTGECIVTRKTCENGSPFTTQMANMLKTDRTIISWTRE
jgi:hypothetical protein